jgi:transglutaminase superfamily protein
MAPSRSIRDRLRRFAQVGNRRRALLIEAATWLLLTRLSLIFIPFPRLARHLGAFVSPTDARAMQTSSTGSPEDVRLAEEIGWAVMRAARHAPFKAVCLPQAMAARIMLRRRGVGSVLHFGAAKGLDKPLDTHAWLDAAGVEVTGYPVARTYAEIACFV